MNSLPKILKFSCDGLGWLLVKRFKCRGNTYEITVTYCSESAKYFCNLPEYLPLLSGAESFDGLLAAIQESKEVMAILEESE